jgi:hypothetical protein
VRVHTGGVAADSARELNAHAYALGHDVVFGAGRFAPETHEGRTLLAHELAHVVQQGNQPARIRRQQSTATSCPLVVASHVYSRGNDDWLECNYETARMTVGLVLDTCACSISPSAGMPLSVNYSALLEGKSFTGRRIPNPSGAGTIREQEGQASHIATGVATPGRSAMTDPTGAVTTTPGMALSEANLPVGTPANTSGPLALTRDDATPGGRPGDPGDTASQQLRIGSVDCGGQSRNGQVNLGGGYQVISYAITADNSGVQFASITLAETVARAPRIPTPLIDVTGGGTPYLRFPGIVRPGGTGCTCNATTGAQVGTGCNRGAGGAGFGTPP